GGGSGGGHRKNSRNQPDKSVGLAGTSRRDTRISGTQGQGSIALIHSAPTGVASAPWFTLARDNLKRESVAGMGLLHRGHLFGAGVALIFRFPGLVGHAVDGFAALVLGQRHALLVGGVLQPVGEAVAAEASEIHQIDVLDVGSFAQMPEKAAVGGRFEFRSGLLINGHGLKSRFCKLAASYGACHRFRHIAAQTMACSSRIRRRRVHPGLKTPLWPLTPAAPLREIVADLRYSFAQ